MLGFLLPSLNILLWHPRGAKCPFCLSKTHSNAHFLIF